MASENTQLRVEREQIARDLQESVVHVLFGIGLELQYVAQAISEEAAVRRVESCVARLDRAISDLRTAVFGLDPRDPNEQELG